MTELAIGVFWLLVVLAVGQGLMVCRFAWIMLRWKPRSSAGQPSPKTAVILCLRGADPFLAACVEALLRQDYPRFEVRVVVDSREDPAWRVIEAVVERCGATNVQIRPLVQRRQTCSLKCSSVVQAVSELDESFEAVALLDADTIPHRTWLRELVAPLSDDHVGASTGNRWYMPAGVSWGSLVRWLWNGAAVVQMYCYGIAWGGTLALKTKVLKQSDLLQRWGNAFCEDTMLYRVLRSEGLRVAFVPSLMMVNREDCTISGFFGWVRRQLLTARLYHPRWALVLVHGISTSLAPVLALGLWLLAMAAGRWESAAWAGGGLAGYLAALPLLLIVIEGSARRIVRARGEPTDWLSKSNVAKALAAILLTQAIYTVALVSLMFARTVQWRGARYRIDGPWNIRLLEDRPDQTSHNSAGAHCSL